MKVKIKGMNSRSKATDEKIRGRSFNIATIRASVQLSDDGLTVTIPSIKLSKSLKNIL